MNILDLYSKPVSYKFSVEEFDFIKKNLEKEKHKHTIKYAFSKKEANKNQIIFVIDSNSNGRKSSVENFWEVFSERPISDIELEEEAHNFGINKKRFTVFKYQNIENLILDDLEYDVQTPIDFVKECNFRKRFTENQTRINF